MGYFLPFYLPTAQKNKLSKKWKQNAWIYHHFTHVQQKWWLEDVRFLPHLKKSIFHTECNSIWDEKKGIVSQILLSKLLYIGQIYTTPKLIKVDIEKTIAQLSIWTSYFRRRYSTKLSRTSMDLKIILPHQCLLERSHAVLIELKE